MNPDGSILYGEAGHHPHSIAAWTTATPLTFNLPGGAAKDVNYTIDVPHDTHPGTYWSVLFFESETQRAPEAQQGFNITTVVRVGHIIYVTVGQPTLEGSIAGIRYDAASGPGALRITFQNSGDGLLRLNGRIEVRTLQGELVQTLALEGEASFPGATHDLVAPLKEPLPSGEYVVLAVLDYGEAVVIAGEGEVEVP